MSDLDVHEAELLYDLAKKEYRKAGQAVQKSPNDPVKRFTYEVRKKEYHRAGDELRRVRRAAR